MQRLFKLLVFFCATVFYVVSCTEEYKFTIADDPGYSAAPISSIQALDGEKWIAGQVDMDTKTITFGFHALSNLRNVPVRVTLDGNWPFMVNPNTNLFTADLSSSYRMTVNDGIDDIIFRLEGGIYQLVKSVKISIPGEENQECSVSGTVVTGKFSSVFLLSELSSVDIEISLNEGATLITPESSFSGVDLSSGKPFPVSIRDDFSGIVKTYNIYVVPSDVVNIDGSWEEITASYQEQNDLSLSPNMRIYRTGSLYGYSGNVGYLFTIPAGSVQMKVVEKNQLPTTNDSKVSAVVRANRDWSLFIPMNCPGVWHVDGSTAATGFTYYSPLAYGTDKNGDKSVLRQEGWGGNTPGYAPALAVKDGKAYMAPAKTDKAANKLYRYTDVRGGGEQDWSDVDCAWGGYFQIVNGGSSLITAEGDRFYTSYNADWRAIQTLTIFTSPSWSVAVPIKEHDALRTGRTAVGCTANGDLVILSVEKFVNTHNQGQDTDKGKNGGSSDTRGLTLCEIANVMAGLGCSEAMTLEDLAWCYVLLQDGGERGKDVFWTNNRWWIDTSNANYGTRKTESAEYANLTVACFK